MLSALLKEASPLDMSNIDLASASASGFGKMLNSLQGLQQRLDDFSITDVTAAAANAQTLILRLSQFQDTITAVALLKNATAEVSRSIAEIAPINTEVVNLDSLENHPQLHAIVKATKLIKLHKLMTVLKAGAQVGESQEEPTHDDIGAVLPIIELTADRPNVILDMSVRESAKCEFTALPELVDESAAASHTLEIDATTAATAAVSPVLETIPDAPTLAFTATEQMPLETLVASEFPTAEAEFETAVAAVVKRPSPAEAALLEDFPAPTEHFAESLAMAALSQSAETKHPPQITAQKQQQSRAKEADLLNASKALIPANENFDLRLLDDLVSNYGEFAANSYLPATIEKKEIQIFEPAASAAEEFQPECPSPVEATAPLVKKNGDLDRQLKKIIKDYGENDLYADKQTRNIKKASILAFVFLGLVFGIIYFFKAPPSTGKSAPAAANSTPSTTQEDQKSQPGAQGANGESRKKSIGSTPNVENPTTKIIN
jgi:hypothetical protein